MSEPVRLGVMWTRELVLKQMGFDPVEDGRRALKGTRDALGAKNYEGQPDHAIRLKAAQQVFKLAGLEQPVEQPPDPSRPVSVTIVLSQPANGHHAGTALQAHGVRLHLSGGDAGAGG